MNSKRAMACSPRSLRVRALKFDEHAKRVRPGRPRTVRNAEPRCPRDTASAESPRRPRYVAAWPGSGPVAPDPVTGLLGNENTRELIVDHLTLRPDGEV